MTNNNPNNIHTLSRDKVMRINKMIIEKISWSFIKFSQIILKGDVWRSVWRICLWILGLKGLNFIFHLQGVKCTTSLWYKHVIGSIYKSNKTKRWWTKLNATWRREVNVLHGYSVESCSCLKLCTSLEAFAWFLLIFWVFYYDIMTLLLRSLWSSHESRVRTLINISFGPDIVLFCFFSYMLCIIFI